MGLFSPHRKKPKLAELPCLCLGEDKNASWIDEQSTGEYLLNQNNRLAYDSCPEAIGAVTIHRNGKVTHRGFTCIQYEGMARPFSFKGLVWANIEHKKEVVLQNALSEGCSMAVQEITDEGRFNKLSTILMLALGFLGILALLAAFQTGLFSQFPKFW